MVPAAVEPVGDFIANYVVFGQVQRFRIWGFEDTGGFFFSVPKEFAGAGGVGGEDFHGGGD